MIGFEFLRHRNRFPARVRRRYFSAEPSYLRGHHSVVLIRVSLLSLPLLSGHPKFKNFVLERAMADKSLKLKVHDE